VVLHNHSKDCFLDISYSSSPKKFGLSQRFDEFSEAVKILKNCIDDGGSGNNGNRKFGMESCI
jgi:hypothetical protein